MANQSFDARIANKRDTNENLESENIVLLNGELVAVDMEDTSVRLKIGDGVTAYKDLPFDDQVVRDILDTKGDASVSVECTLLATGWTDGTQSLKIEGLGENGIAALAQEYNEEQYTAAMLAEITVTGQTENSLIFTANGTTPAIDIPIVVILLG